MKFLALVILAMIGGALAFDIPTPITNEQTPAAQTAAETTNASLVAQGTGTPCTATPGNAVAGNNAIATGSFESSNIVLNGVSAEEASVLFGNKSNARITNLTWNKMPASTVIAGKGELEGAGVNLQTPTNSSPVVVPQVETVSKKEVTEVTRITVSKDDLEMLAQEIIILQDGKEIFSGTRGDAAAQKQPGYEGLYPLAIAAGYQPSAAGGDP